jgi:glycosyltransferase involved in cell wall biosynthesis
VKILHVVPTYLPAVRYGGPIHSVHGLCRALAQRGHEVHVATTNVDGAGTSDVPLHTPVTLEGVQVRYFPCALGRRLYRSPTMGRFLRSATGEYSVVHVHSVFLWPSWAATRSAARNGTPYVISPRGMLVADLMRRKSRLLKWTWVQLIERRSLRRAAAVHVTSPLEAEELRALGLPLPPALWEVPNGVPVSIATATEPDEPPFVLFLGRVNWKKGLDRLIPAMARVPGAKLVVAGNDEEGYGREVRSLAERHGVAGRVEFAGYVAGEEKRQWLSRAALLVLPSYSENFGNVVLEAWAQCRPVVITREVGLAEAVTRGGGGLVVDGEPEALATAIRLLLADPVRRRQCGDAGRAMVEREFAWPMIAQRMETLYQTLRAAGR